MLILLEKSMKNEYKYDVCFSYAKEQVEYVKQVYSFLNEHGVRVFFDKAKDIESNIWGCDLAEVFDEIYNRDSRYCMIFISKEYKESNWARAEVRNALGRFIKTSERYLLPVIFDDIHIPGVPDTVQHMDARIMEPKTIGELFIKLLEQETVSHCKLENIYTVLSTKYANTKIYENKIIVYDTSENPLCIMHLEKNKYHIYDICLFFKSCLEYYLSEEELNTLIQTVTGDSVVC